MTANSLCLLLRSQMSTFDVTHHLPEIDLQNWDICAIENNLKRGRER